MAGTYCDTLPESLREGLLFMGRVLETRPLAQAPTTPELRAEAYTGLQRLSLGFLLASCLFLGALIVAWEPVEVGTDSGTGKGRDDALLAVTLFMLWDLASRDILMPLSARLLEREPWGALFLGQSLSYGLLLAALVRMSRWPGLGRVSWPWACRGYLLCAVAISAANALASGLTGVRVFARNPTLAVFDAAPAAVWIPLALWLVAVGPLLEEVLFRGLLLSALSNRYGDRTGLLLSSLLFALAHRSLWTFPYLLAGGLVLGWLARRSGSLATCIVAHSLWNLTWLVQAFVSLS